MFNRNEPRTTDTKEQLTVSQWLINIGIGFTTEEEFPPYVADIYVRDLNLIIELDGPHHRKKKDEIRDAFLKDEHSIDVWRFKNDLITKDFESEFTDMIIERAEKLYDAQT